MGGITSTSRGPPQCSPSGVKICTICLGIAKVRVSEYNLMHNNARSETVEASGARVDEYEA